MSRNHASLHAGFIFSDPSYGRFAEWESGDPGVSPEPTFITQGWIPPDRYKEVPEFLDPRSSTTRILTARNGRTRPGSFSRNKTTINKQHKNQSTIHKRKLSRFMLILWGFTVAFSWSRLKLFKSYISKGIWREGIGSFCKEFRCFNTMPCRHMPLLVHFWLLFVRMIYSAGSDWAG